MAGSVDLRTDDCVAIITICYEERLNALSAGVRRGLFDAFSVAERDPDVRAVVVTGAGDKAFCSGADLKEMTETGMAKPDLPGRPDNAWSRDYMPQLGRNIASTKPVIAAVNGYALGGGLLLAQQCDMVVAAMNARFGMPEARWGRGAPWSVPLQWQIPKKVWAELAFRGTQISAERAYEIGLANVVVPEGQALAVALEWAREISEGAPLTVRATKRMLDASTGQVTYPGWDLADALFEEMVYGSNDAQQGPKKYAEGKSVTWTGR